MPIYEFRCPACGAGFELLRAMAQADLPADCLECGVGAERRVSAIAAVPRAGSSAEGPSTGRSPCRSCSASSCASCR